MSLRTLEYKWRALGLLMAVLFLQQGARQIFSATLPQLRADLSADGVSSMQLGAVVTVFTVVYGLFVPLSGFVSDFFRRKWMIVGGCLLFAVGIFVCGFSSGMLSLFVSYGFFVAIGQSIVGPSSTSLVGQLHKESRATAFSVKQLALYAGILISSVVSGRLASLGTGGWRRAFILFGALGIALAIVLVFALRDTPNEGEAFRGSLRAAAVAMFEKPTALLLALAFGMHIVVDTGFKTWMPAFLQTEFSLSPSQAAFHAVLWHYLGAAVGVWVGGRLSDRLARARRRVRLELSAAGMLLAVPFVFLMASATSLPVCLFSAAVYGFARGIYDANLFASFFEVVDARYRASATGLMLCMGFVVGAHGPMLLGFVADRFSLAAGLRTLSVFYVGAAMVTSAAIVLFFRRDCEKV